MFSGCPLGSAPTSSFWLADGGRIRSATACRRGSVSALTQAATRPAVALFAHMRSTYAGGPHGQSNLLSAGQRGPIGVPRLVTR
jgi:hypothetical protein